MSLSLEVSARLWEVPDEGPLGRGVPGLPSRPTLGRRRRRRRPLRAADAAVAPVAVLAAARHLLGGVGGAGSVPEQLLAPPELVVGAVKHLRAPAFVWLALKIMWNEKCTKLALTLQLLQGLFSRWRTWVGNVGMI